ncbi:MAG: MaoC family dehydratase N-terminal domain-containing protein [Haloarculaceae archaeon]
MPDRPLAELEAQVGDTNRTVVDMAVEAGKVEEFARVVGDDDPVHRDPAVAADRGFDAVPAPLTFTRTSYFPRYRPAGIDIDLGFDLGFREEYVVHGEQAYDYERPLIVGDVLTGETTLTDVYQREGRRGGTMTFAVLETAFRDRDGDLVVTERSTRIETAGAIGDDDAATDGGSPADEDAAPAGRASSARATVTDADGTPVSADEVAVGDAGPTLTVADVRREDFVRYAGASGDFNPIHYDEPYATAAGNESVFGQGMLTAGYAASMVSDWFGLDAVIRFQTRFEGQLFPGETVTVTGELTDVTARGDGAAVVADFAAVTDDGDRLLSGEVEADLPPA